ncbi:MAG: hypothetical protein ABIK84_02145 [candidate division WOR-3 bacterium]
MRDSFIPVVYHFADYAFGRKVHKILKKKGLLRGVLLENKKALREN